ncbi:hypothetical protein IQ218_07375 [Synechocystis salina LEGE 06099]|uniref:hypothetical protein n=1 Tax=Synechocystis salina TaxID=945780 RepID=UPI00188272CE|nr:hypothetical protein [Synechocystis salina]MBE9203302.1 hypothetical protein [Synechocystis salina LEGE 06099]
MSKIEKSVQRQETKFQSTAPKYRELSDSELEVVCGGIAVHVADFLVQSPESTVKSA